MSAQQVSKNAVMLIDADEIGELNEVEDSIDIVYVEDHIFKDGGPAVLEPRLEPVQSHGEGRLDR